MILRLKLVAALVVFFLSVATTFARLRPTFGLEFNTWQATDIILVRDDGKLRPTVTVLESWKGTLHPGDSIVVSGLLAAGAPKPKLAPDLVSFPDAVEGGYVVFFLSHQPAAVGADRREGTWKGPVQEDMFLYTSAAFVRNNSVFRFSGTGPTNFEPDTLQQSGLTDAQFKSEVQSVLNAQDDLRIAAAIKSADERTKILVPIAKTGYASAQREAIRLLGECGAPAIPILRDLVISTSKHCKGDWRGPPYLDRDIANAFAAAAGPDRANELTAVITEELAYWKKNAPSLPVGWWNNIPSAEVPHTHYSRLLSALKNLSGVYKPSAEDPVKQIRDLWISLPQLNDKTGLDQIIEACDTLMR